MYSDDLQKHATSSGLSANSRKTKDWWKHHLCHLSAKPRVLEGRYSSKVLAKVYVPMNLQCLFIKRRRKKEKKILLENFYLFLGDMLVCGLENGAFWILHHITLDPIDEIPYKHSSTAVNKVAFTPCAKYMAYAVKKLD